jgi:hypothetical protein
MAFPRIVSVLLVAQAAAGLTAPTAWAVDSVSGVLDGSSPTWDRRVPDDGFRNLGCGLITNDSSNDGMGYAVFEIQVSEPEDLAVSVVAGGTTISDTILYLYCDPFDPLQPANNLIATADDILPGQDLLSAFTPARDIMLTPGQSYFLVLTGFTAEDLGTFELEITSPTAVFVSEPSVGDPIVIDVQVMDEPGGGFNDPVLGPQRLNAMRTAAELWGSFFTSSYPGETVEVLVEMVPSLGELGALTAVFATTQSTDLGDITMQWPILEHISGQDVHDGPGGLIQFSEEVDFYLEPTGDPGDRLDFVTLALHEMGHVFGFISNLVADGTYDGTPFGPIPNYYDLFLRDADGFPLVALLPEERAAAATSGDGLLWGGPAGVAGNGGVPPNLSAPETYIPATSVLHISETFFPGDVLMDAALLPGEVFRTLAPVERGMFQDMGWTLAPEPRASALIAIGALAVLRAGRLVRRRAAGGGGRRTAFPLRSSRLP